MKRSALTDQMEWYLSQPTGYRRLWWEWARTQPNFREMKQWADLHEQDDSVRRAIAIWSERAA